MGFFGSYVFDGAAWHGYDPDSEQMPDIAGPWLSVDIHDSDIATVRYEPAGPGSGTAYLGFTPMVYFGSESALAPTDVLREAGGLAFWLTRHQDRNDEPELRQLIAPFLAENFAEQQADPGDDADDLDEAHIFVEIKVSELLKAVGLPVPDELPGRR